MTHSLLPSSLNPMPKWVPFNLHSSFSTPSRTQILSYQYFIFPSILRACSGFGDLVIGEMVHGAIVKNGFAKDSVIQSSLLSVYGEMEFLSYAKKMFDEMTVRDLASWSSIILSYVENGKSNEGLEIIRLMVLECIRPDSVTMLSVAEAGGVLGFLILARSIHGYIVRRNIESYGSLTTSLVAMYSKCGDLMQTRGLMPDAFSLASSLSACADGGFLLFGDQIHVHIIKRGLFNEFVENLLIDMYSKCGFAELAYMVFDEIKEISVVTWNSMICVFHQNGNSVEAINLIDQMKDLYIDTALTDMYAKCGDLLTAQRVFNSMPEKSVVSWTVTISGYGAHGRVNDAISLFNQMMESGVRTHQIIFMNILSAFSHAGSMEDGKFYFNLMRDFAVEPNSEHYTCMVDLLKSWW
ncbi:hypothetical protein F3Y22_tig00111427pilonHSYRG00624 [Hibiscus syriacus]|uniref:Pentatricopeptide repeat-containing protein n=1 Tax=Hibiscus syriacus TaxID=106335 RepID=A0A6A2XS02_HIBSY|nr:hypothetical protein F3Y22_tig00111427pilonHSYRG00624 [Hibiscus syriacus]